MIERVDFDRMPTESERLIWCEWLRKHGVNPNDVIATGWIERRPDAYQLAYLSIELDDDGRPRYDRQRDDFVWTERVFQMEGPPLPFPDVGSAP